ncbi:helix-turn-helix domain-containing protein [Stakelama marina]|uniref:Helix-turn-helix domain-containing protein n=1 Tax=Stakelama marina TaxID=2826939 RepID=A0A8T4IHK1_9SPHN|nr:helix-turn-helix domain-containing protein [Stakelama marina]MBR0551769.1 helix-turn-helix domain-containing protein [Stakelama marina]
MAESTLLFSEIRNVQKFMRDETIVPQGESATCWYEVVHGAVRVCQYHSDGRRQIIGFAFPGDVVGLEWGMRQSCAEALVPSQLFRHDLSDLSLRMGGVPTAVNGEHPALESALAAAHQSIALLGLPTALERVAGFLLALARRLNCGTLLCLPMPRVDIADYLGLTMHTVSRTMSELVRRGLIALDAPNRARILAPEHLGELAGFDFPEDTVGEAQLVA